MREPAGQEQRAFWAILLAMAVLLLWSVVFPPARAPEKPSVAETEAPARPPTPTFESPSDQETEVPATSGSLLGVDTGAGSLLRATNSPEPVEVRVEQPDLHVTIDARGARLVEASLPAYHEGGGEPVRLLPEQGPGALGTVVGLGERDLPLDQFVFDLVSDESTSGGRRIVWDLVLEEFTLRKTFVVPNEGQLLQVRHDLLEDHVGVARWGLSWAGGMRTTEEQLGSVRGGYFVGAVLAEGKVQRKDPNALKREPIEFPGHTYYIAAQNKYFMGAIVPRGDQQGPAKLWSVPGGGEGNSSVGGEILVDRSSGIASDMVDYDVYIGPLDYAGLKELGIGLEEAVDLGMSWIRPLSRLILSFLIWLHGLIPNYGVVIILFASLVNVAFFPLTFKSMRSMRDMAALKPRMDALKDKYKDEPQKMQEAVMKLYKEAGVNPLAGCMPLLLQMPIFFALYAVLFRTIELRQEPFMLWIRDLSQPDVVFNLPFSLPLIGAGVCLLPIIMGITSFFQSKATMVDPSQKTMMYMMPVMMTFIFFTMPSGLVLYWLTSNVFTIVQKSIMKPTAGVEAVAEAPVEEVVRAKRRKRKRGSAKGGADPANAES